jgi:hypothetical protein
MATVIHSGQTLPSSGMDQSSVIDIGHMSYFALLFYLLLDSMSIRKDTVATQSKEISANSATQSKLNDANAEIKFSILPEGAKQDEIQRVSDENTRYAALREDIQNSLITARQKGQVMMTQTSTNVNILQQDASMDSGWLKALNTIFEVLDEITKR